MGITTTSVRRPVTTGGGHGAPEEPHDVAVVVHVDGELDVRTSPPLRDVLRTLLRQGSAEGAPCVVVDLQGVTFMDSSALGVLVHGWKMARAHHRTFALVSTGTAVERLFRVTGMQHVMPLHPDLESALRAPGPYARPSVAPSPRSSV